ncbi:MAG TPA: fused MFS/spermidine synthase [Rhizomicrobium sp.]|nr:fused MFS/spermidine synthase [Rhizomicrobium sp.]
MTLAESVSPVRAERMFSCAALFTATSFLSALLLFCLEPMFSKMVLPVLGGSSAVWSIAMAVFQGLLLAGYVYAWILTRWLPLRSATLVHLAVLAVAAIFLPVGIAHGFALPPNQGLPLWLVSLFLASIGMPFFAVAANAPLLQAWFARTEHKDAADPYFLYRASNFGSFAVLLAYPFFIEPAWGLAEQSRIWAVGYALLVLCIALCGSFALSLQRPEALRTATANSSPVAWTRRIGWVAFGFVPSGLLVAVTAHIATDVASAPFLWIAPLALYLFTFVLAFTEKPFLKLEWLLAAQPFSIVLLVVLLFVEPAIPWGLALFGNLAAFFIAALICQTLLYRSRPQAQSLTEFYAWMSLGGVLGGIFAALIAPQIFNSVIEYPLLILASFALRPEIKRDFRASGLREIGFVFALSAAAVVALFAIGGPTSNLGQNFYAVMLTVAALALPFFARNRIRFLALATVLVCATNLFPPGQGIVLRARSFFGVYKITQAGNYHLFLHGTTRHGAEEMRDMKGRALTGRPEPLAYYHRAGGLAEAIEAARAHANVQRVAVVGLGIGSLSCYIRPHEHWTFYELDPLVLRLARDPKLFRSFDYCARGVPVVLGDARLTLRDTKPGVDILVLDAFTSDSVPVHLLTREAFALYRSKLARHGVVIFHISNRNLELSDVVAASAAANGMVAMLHPMLQERTNLLHRYPSEVAVVAQSPADLRNLHLGAEWHPLPPGRKVWTDDYSDVLGALLERMTKSR